MKKYDAEFVQECYENFVDSDLQNKVPFIKYIESVYKGLDEDDILWALQLPDKEKIKKQRNGFKIELREKVYNIYFEDFNNTIVKCTILFDIPELDRWGYKSVGVAKIFDPEKYPDHQYSEDEINDTFDLYIGRKMAYDKALDKMINIHNREIKKFTNQFKKDINFVDNAIEKRVDKFFRKGK